MVSLTHARASVHRQPSPIIITWIVTLLISALPTILWQEWTGHVPSWVLWARICLPGALLLIGAMWRVARPLRPYFGVLLALGLAESLIVQLAQTSWWRHWFGAEVTPFAVEMLGVQILRLGVAGIMIGMLLMLHKQRSWFFLIRGRLDAEAMPVRWLGMTRPVPWRRLGPILTLCISGGTLAFLVLAGRPSARVLIQVIPLIPAVLVFAAMNAFSEELNYRAAFLAPLHRVVGERHALLLTAVFFGLGHYYGVPYGVIGVIMASVLGWLLGKSMLETRGFFWAWFIHFWQDVLIFSFMAIGSIATGGS